MSIKLDQILVGEIIEIRLDGQEGTEQAVFVGISGEGEEREVGLISAIGGKLVRWGAYRYNNRWAYGSSAGRIAFLAIANR